MTIKIALASAIGIMMMSENNQGCTKCSHTKDEHRDSICYNGFCTCISFEKEITDISLKKNHNGTIQSRTLTPLP